MEEEEDMRREEKLELEQLAAAVPNENIGIDRQTSRPCGQQGLLMERSLKGSTAGETDVK